MIFGAQNDNLFDQKPQPLSISDDALLSLLTRPLPSNNAGGMWNSETPSQAFYEPFNDPDMEPLPIGSNQETVVPDLNQSLYALLSADPFGDTSVGNKRQMNLEDLLASESSQSQSKRQRTTTIDSSDETVMRFRPYQEKQWRGMYQKLVQYKHKNGHCCVPHSFSEDPMLARWVKRQRYQRKKFDDNDPTSTMTSHRIQLLESLGFVWHSHASAWQTKLNELKAFKHQRGHCNVPSSHTDNIPLATWVRSQRRQYQLWKSGCQSTMTIQRHEQLAALGFSFENPNSKKDEEF